jgi:tyrosinase
MMGEEAQDGIPDNLESIHDTLHIAIGRGGHMYDVAYSAFNLIFWLLHT